MAIPDSMRVLSATVTRINAPAIQCPFLPLRELLRENPARIRERGPHDFALTYYPSIGGGNVEAAQVLVEFRVDVDMEGQLGQTGLHWAARAGQTELVEFWLDQGADVNARVRASHPHTPDATPLDFAKAAERSEPSGSTRRVARVDLRSLTVEMSTTHQRKVTLEACAGQLGRGWRLEPTRGSR